MILPKEQLMIYLDSGPNQSSHEMENLLWYFSCVQLAIACIIKFYRMFLCELGKDVGVEVNQRRWTSKV